MKKVNHSKSLLIALMSMLLIAFTACKKEGCTDPNADNYDSKAKADCCCLYPVINLSSNTGDGDVTGGGGSASKSVTWANGNSQAEYAMDITSAKGGSFRLIIKDANGTVVLDRKLTKGFGDDSASGCTAVGVAGDWSITVILTNFNGDGSYTVDPAGAGC